MQALFFSFILPFLGILISGSAAIANEDKSRTKEKGYWKLSWFFTLWIVAGAFYVATNTPAFFS